MSRKRKSNDNAVISKFGLDLEDTTDESELDLSKTSQNSKSPLPFANEDGNDVANLSEDAHEDVVESMASLFFEGNKRKTVAKKPKEKSNDDTEELLSIDVPFVAVRDLLHKADEQLPEQIKDLPTEYRNLYDRWLFYLSEGFNILLNGYGSKKLILEDFCEQKLRSNYSYVVVRGYLSNLRVKDIVLNLAENLNVKFEPTSNVDLLARRFTAELDKQSDVPDVILVIYNIDGPSLRDDNAQTALSRLAESKFLHIISTVDNVNMPSMWDLAKLERFRWIAFDTPTYRSYVDEIIGFGNSKVLGLNSKSSSNLHNLTSLNSIWASLTQNARQMFTILANSQKNRSISFWDLYKICRDEFIVNSEAALRQQLVEFEDHRLIIRRTGFDGGEVLEIAVEPNVLTQFLAERNHSEEDSDASS